MLAKGPVAPFLAAVIIVIFAVAKKDSGLLRRTLWIPGILLFLVVSLPWYVAVQWKNPEFFRVFILQHNLARFGTNLYHHPEPFWYYVPVVLLALIPWTVFVVASLCETIRVWWTEREEMLKPEDALNVFLVIWLTVPVVFFSLSRSKLPGYIVPALPAGTLLLAEYVRRRVTDGERPNIFLIVAHAIAAAAPIVPALMIQYVILQHRFPWGKVGVIRFAIAAGLAIGIAVTLRTRLGLGALRFVTLVPVLLAVWALLGGAPVLDSTLSVRPLANEISHLEKQATSACGVRRFSGNRIWARLLSKPSHRSLRTGTDSRRRTSRSSSRRIADRDCQASGRPPRLLFGKFRAARVELLLGGGGGDGRDEPLSRDQRSAVGHLVKSSFSVCAALKSRCESSEIPPFASRRAKLIHSVFAAAIWMRR